eukprot:1226273-Karenia_brevis.AAC.1
MLSIYTSTASKLDLVPVLVLMALMGPRINNDAHGPVAWAFCVYSIDDGDDVYFHGYLEMLSFAWTSLCALKTARAVTFCYDCMSAIHVSIGRWTSVPPSSLQVAAQSLWASLE